MIETQRPPIRGTETPARLRVIDSTDAILPIGATDFRDAKVRDRDGVELGRVDGMLFDASQQETRFLRISSGGFLGLGARQYFVPVDAVAATAPGQIVLEHRTGDVRQAPAYSPDLVDEQAWMEASYRHFGYLPA
jgi:hypothetical protein